MGPAALPIAAFATVVGVSEQRKANKAARRANRAQERSAAIQNLRSRRRARAEGIQVQAAVHARGVATGTAGASTTQGIASSVSTQLASNVNFQSQLESLDKTRFSALRSQSKALANASTFTSIANLATKFDT